MDPAVVAQIDERLARICVDHKVRIPLAIESGSRAWGFPSPDSDYDCRFIYVRPTGTYLSLWHTRDVIETPVDRLFDVNGWDLAKAVKLLLKGNAVVIEWLTSPISYGTDPGFKADFLALVRNVASRQRIARHYLHLGERQRRTYFRDGKAVPLKKVFYALRPAAALRWLRVHSGETVAPMHFPTLLAECGPPEIVAELARTLIKKKAQTRELASEPLPDPIARFIDSEFDLAQSWVEGIDDRDAADARVLCDEFFVAQLSRFGGAS